MTERWVRKLRSRLDAFEMPSDLRERATTLHITHRADRRPSGPLVAAGIAVILIVGGFATLMLLLLRPLAELSPGAGSNPASTPDTVRVECGEETLLLTSSVVRQPDGVHFELSNPGRAGALFTRDPLDPQDSWMRGALADVTHAEFTLPLRPGTVLVACLHPPVNTLELPAEAFERLTVLPGTEGEQGEG